MSAQGQQVQARPGSEEQQVGTVLFDAAIRVAKRNWVVVALWFFGLLVIAFGTGFEASPEAQEEYFNMMEKANAYESRHLAEIEHKVMVANQRYYDSKGWFWTCNDVCTRNYAKLQKLQEILAEKEAKYKEMTTAAKSKVGIWSKQGVAETREQFWTSWEGGKGFAKRQSMWDALFIILSSRDEGIGGALVRWLLNLIFNFTIGLFGALMHFMWVLWGIVQSYGAGLLGGLLFFFVAAVAASSMVGLFLGGMYATAATGVYGMAKVAHQQRLEQARQAERIRGQGGGYQNPYHAHRD